MAKPTSNSPVRIKIGGVEMTLRPQPQRGSIPDDQLRKAVMKAVAAEQHPKKS